MNQPKPIDVYLNDHLAGSVGAIEIAKRCANENTGNDLGQFLSRFLADVEEDQRTLEGLMDAVGAARNPIKQAGAWFSEKLSRIKFGTEEKDLSNLLSVEALSMGVEGKMQLWKALREVDNDVFTGFDFDRLLERAQSQRDGLERHRLELARRTLGVTAPV